MTPKIAEQPTTARKGRQPDRTPGKEFVAKKLRDLANGKAEYEIPFNDKNGNRQTRKETRVVGKRGRQEGTINAAPNKVMTPKMERSDDNYVLTVPFNDKDGVRKSGTVTLSVNKLGNLAVTVV